MPKDLANAEFSNLQGPTGMVRILFFIIHVDVGIAKLMALRIHYSNSLYLSSAAPGKRSVDGMAGQSDSIIMTNAPLLR